MFSDLFPIISSTDVARSLGFYRDQLGGKVSFEYPAPDGSLAYVGVDIGSAHLGIGFSARPVGGELPRPISLWIYATSCDAAVARLRAGGTPILEPPADQPWGERIARVLDPDGNEVIIGQRADS